MSEERIVGFLEMKCIHKINFVTNYHNFKTLYFYNVKENNNKYIIVNMIICVYYFITRHTASFTLFNTQETKKLWKR